MRSLSLSQASFCRSSVSLLLAGLLAMPAGSFAQAPSAGAPTTTSQSADAPPPPPQPASSNADANSKDAKDSKDSKSKGSKKDPDDIGDRNVSGKVNFYSLEKEIALGKGLAQQVERGSKVVNDPVVLTV